MDAYHFRSIGISDIAEGSLEFKDAVRTLINPRSMPRTGDELREMSPKEIIEGREDLLPAERRTLLGLLPDATIINRLHAITDLEHAGET